MRPGPRIWASNALWAAGPDVGVATKIPMAAGELADGRYRAIRPAPQLDNYELWAIASRLHGAASMRLLNVFNRFDLNTVGLVGGFCHGCWDPVALTASMVEERAAAAMGEFISIGGLQPWGAGAGFPGPPPPPAGVVGQPRIAIDPATQNRAVVDDCAAGDLPWASVAYGVFAPWPGGSLANQWCALCHTVIGDRFVFGDQLALIHRAQNPAAITSAPATPPGFAAARITALAASNHAAADVYPSDPGNDCVIAMTATEVSSSSGTCNVWTAAALHLLGSVPLDLAYSKAGSKWIAILANGQIGTSLDNGATWAATASLPGAMAASTTSMIACDGYGDWMALLIDAGGPTTQLFASWDDGVTWVQVFLPVWVTAVNAGCIFYGGGQFIFMCIDNGAVSWVYTTLRGDE